MLLLLKSFDTYSLSKVPLNILDGQAAISNKMLQTLLILLGAYNFLICTYPASLY